MRSVRVSAPRRNRCGAVQIAGVRVQVLLPSDLSKVAGALDVSARASIAGPTTRAAWRRLAAAKQRLQKQLWRRGG